MQERNYGEQVEILLVEDSDSDVHLTKRVLERSKIKNNLSIARDGVEALAFLRREEGYEDVPRPGLILLDLNMPRMNGQEVLAEVKSDPNLAAIPIVVLTTSNDEQDVLQSYGLHANCYMCKPVDLPQFVNVIQAIENFWLTVVRLPTADAA